VIHTIQQSEFRTLFNPENIFISKDGGGAGNIWASGYYQAEKVQEHLLDMIGAASLFLFSPYPRVQIEKQSTATAWRDSLSATRSLEALDQV